MRKVVFLFLLLSSFNFLLAQEEEGKPEAYIQETTHEIQDVIKGTRVEYSFVLKNTGTAPLKILQARPS